jgi:acyl-coenzyme A thioesterase PaaI-like protein
VRVRLPLSWRTYNYHGTTFGGSVYGAVDPIHAIMLIQRLGSGHEVWVKGATVQFLKPGRSDLWACFRLEDAEVEAVREQAAAGALERTYEVDLVDGEGVPHARVAVTLHVRRRRPTPEGRAEAWPGRAARWLLGGRGDVARRDPAQPPESP